MKLGSIAKAGLRKCGYKVERIDKDSRKSSSEERLSMALTELNSLYNEFVFNKEFTVDATGLDLLQGLMGTGFGEGLYLIDYLHKVLLLEGDICEFGVAQGATSALLAYEIRDTRKKIWLFDSFEGLPEPSEKDILINDVCGLGSIEAYKGEMACPEDMVRARLSDIGFPPDRINIVPGFLEDTIHNAHLPEKVCFAYIDFALYEPTLIALQYLDKVLVRDGIIGIDDYDFFSKGVKTAVDEFYYSRKGDYDLIFPLKSAGPFCFLRKIH